MARIAALSLLICAAAGLAGCATGKEPKSAICDGHHRRPANLYGSVLPDAPLPAAAGAQAPIGDAKAAPGPLSTTDPQSFGRCGRTA